MHRFFVDSSDIDGHVIHITGTDVNHIRNVLRMRVGDELMISDGGGKDYRCFLEAVDEKEVLAHIIYAQEANQELPCRIYLFQGLPKGDKMELIIQKAVELGVWEIIPVSTARAVVRLDLARAEKKRRRWQQIAGSAAEQSGRARIPDIHAICDFREALSYASACQVKMIPYELASGMRRTREVIGAISPGQSVAVLIGPEGGFSEMEVQTATDAGWQPITLGRRILRTETAGMAVLSILMYTLEEE